MSSDDGKEESSNISNLQESFSKQQEKISALKELVRKSEVAHGKSTTSAQEKVKNIAQKLTDLKSKAKSRKLEDVPSQQDATNETETTISNIQTSLLPLPATDYSTPDPTPHKVQQYNVTATLSPATSTPSSEKILLLRQQMEHNKARMAQRASSKQHLEQLVTQLKVKFDSTQQSLEDTAELGRSMNDLSALMYIAVPKERHKSATDLSTQPFNLEKERMKFLENRCRLLEKQLEKESQVSQSAPKRIKELENKVLELQETINQSSSKEIDNLVAENNKLQNELLEKIKEVQQLKDVQLDENISRNYQNEIERLSVENKELSLRITELEAGSTQIQGKKTVEHDSSQFERDFDMLSEEKDALLKRIEEFVEINDVLETARCDLTVKCNETEETLRVCQEQLLLTKKELQNLQDKFDVQQQTVALQSNVNTDTKTVDKDTDTQVKDEMAQQIQELQLEIQNLREQNLELKETISNIEKIEVNDVSIADKIAALEATIESQREDLTNRTEALNKNEEELMEKTIELNVLNANFKVLEEKLHANTKSKPLFSAGMNDADNPELQNEIQQLKQKLDESNKAMIKLKLKLKQTEKQMEKLKKTSDLHAETIILQNKNEELQQKITELEDEKGQWQLSQVDDNKSRIDSSDNSQKIDKEIEEEKLKTLEETIRLLEEQKYDLSEKCGLLTNNLEALQQEVSKKNNDETARVKSEMTEIHMEEQLEKQTQLVKSLEKQLTAKAAEVEELQSKIGELNTQKQETDKKLEHYINENMELLDKIEKLSKSSSSAESIEIVERLTQQERAEIDEYNQIDQEHVSEHEPSLVHEITQTEMGSELSENITQLREESAELINKIELFTNERREVLGKMELLTAENQELKNKIADLTEEKELIEINVLLAENTKSKLEIQLNEVTKEKEVLAAQIAESNAQNRELCQGLTSLQKSSEVMAAIDSAEHPTLFDKCEKSLSKLYSEIEAYRKANDKNTKFNVSKKLAKEAKNAHAQLSELLQKVKEASTAVETVTVVETVVAVTAPNGKALAEYEQLTAQNRELKTTVNELRQEIQELKEMADTPTAVTPYINEGKTNESSKNLQETLEKLGKTEEDMIELQSTVENLRIQLQEARLACEEKSDEIARLDEEILSLRKLSEDFDQLMNEKEMSFEKQIEHLTRLRKELESKCETYEGEMEILHTLVTEQKQQIIEIYKENEHEINLKLLDLQQRDEQINHLHAEIKGLKDISATVKVQFSEDLQKECDKLRESLKISKALVTEQVEELSNKQDTIETLNQQIIDLYKTMEENANKIIEKEDEITYMQDLVDRNNKDLERFTKENEEQKSVVDKLLMELHSHKQNAQHTSKLEMEVQRLDTANKELENITHELQQKNKEQLEKLKKYAANLKKRTAQCQELETRLKDVEKGALDALQQKENKHSDAELAEISELNAKNLLLYERITELQQNYNDVQLKSNEIREALQLKTMEILETMERNANLESELDSARISVAQKTQETVQLQNALAASQGQMSDWDNDTSFTFKENNQQELAEKTAYIETLQTDLLLKNEEILQLNNKSAQLLDQLEYNLKLRSELAEELEIKTTVLEKTEATLNDVQLKLIQSSELEKSREQGKNEFILQIQQQEDQIQQLTLKLSEMQNSEAALPTLQQQMAVQEQRIHEIGEELKAKSLKFEKSKAVIKERNNQIQQLRAQLKDLQNKLSSQPEEEAIQPVHSQVQTASHPTTATHITIEEHAILQQAYDKLKDDYDTEKANFVKTISRLEALHDGIQAKLQEDMSYMETLEQENAKFKDKICKLEECVACFEERRASMERRANLLDAQLQSRADEYEKTEDELIYRLNMLSNHDEVIGQRLIDSQEEKEELQERIDRFQMDYSDLSLKHTKLEKDYEAYRQQTVVTLENENAELNDQLKKANNELDRLRSIYDAKLAAKTTEIDELECDLSDQLQKMNTEKRKMNEELEKSRDECTLQKDEIVRLKESLNTLEQSKQELERELTWLRMQSDNAQQDQYELQELRMQTMQDKTEIDELRHQVDALAANHEIELQALRTQICELDTLRMQVGQNQTDDQVFIESENKRLTDLLAEKSTIIENYQRQNLQLQMAAAAATNQAQQIPNDPFAQAFALPPPHNVSPATLHTDDRERELLEKTEANNRLQRELNALQSEFNAIVEANTNMQRQLLEYNREIENLRMPQARMSSSQYTNDVIPAPQMFFASEQMISSPFDEIVQIRTENNLEGGVNYRPSHESAVNNTIEQPTIEDLQRNVSDLEKHAQDLENKLATRNQLDAEYEDRLRETQLLLNDSETRVLERDQQLQQARTEISQLEQQKIRTEQSSMEGTMQLSALQNKILELETLLTTKHEQLRELELKLQTSMMQADQNSACAANQLKVCENNLQQMQVVLQERDEEIKELKFVINEQKQMKEIETVSSLDKQIITEVDGNDSAIKPTLDMFFGGPATTEFEKLVMSQVSDEPIVEEIIVPKKAYTCQPTEEVLTNRLVAGVDLGDDWGDSWGNNEAAAEAAHFASTVSSANASQSLVSREQQLEIQLQEEIERTQELQLALNSVEQQKQELQMKSSKLMKKLKEYKTKIDELQQSQSTNVFRKSISVDSNSMFNDLDAAIQEELKNQITKLEAQLEEQQKVVESSLVEKEKLLSRIDVLTAGNERMSEMKDRQDMDVQMYQTRIRELQQQLNKLEDWGGDSTNDVTPSGHDAHQTLNAILPHTTDAVENFETLKNDLSQNIAQLTAEIADLNGDKLEIQALLEEEKSNVARAEETVRMLQQRVSVLENANATNEGLEKSKFNDIKLEYQNLQEKYNNMHDDYEKIKSEVNRLHEQEEKLAIELEQKECSLQNGQSQIEKLQNILQETEVQFNEVQMEVLDLKTQIQHLQMVNAELQESNDKSNESKTISLEVKVDTLSKQYEEILQQKQLLDSQIMELKAENTRLQLATSLTSSEEVGSDELAAQLQEKESEILHLKQRIEDLMREDQTEKLVLEILMKNQEMHSLKTQVKQLEDDKHELQNKLSLQITEDMQISKNTEDTSQLEEQLLKMSSQVKTLEEEKHNMEEELKVLNNHVLSSLEQEDKMKTALLNMDLKDIEIMELRKTLEAVTTINQASEKSSDDTKSEHVDFIALNAQWEAIVEQRCGEIAQMWRDHMEKREEEFKVIEAGLQEEITKLKIACNTSKIQKQHSISTETTPSDSTTASGSSSAAPSKESTPLHTRIVNEENVTENENIIEKMRAVLESQEMEIVTLKEQLAIRSAEYARLAAQYDPFKLQTTLSHSGMTTVTTTPTADSTINRRSGGDGSLVPKSELDFALYMLHQRDMRCDEMTLELVSLLEERDTLQLKLSNTLRLVEEMKAQTNYVELCTNREEGTTTSNSEYQEKSTVAGSTSTDSANELSQKLSQLQTVSHSKDKVIKEERDQRIRQMERIQQDLAKIPPAAVSEIVGTDLSQTSQSPSSVLLNWLWGNKPSTGGDATSN